MNAGQSVNAWVGLGSNLGDRRAHLDGALRELGALAGCRVVAVSTWIETEPVGGPAGQGRYLNGAVALETSLRPRELLTAFQRIERAHGRDREVEVRHGPRTLDLDLLLYGVAVVNEQDLVVPHPRLAEREFVLRPLAEIAAHALVPSLGLSVQQLLGEQRWRHATVETPTAASPALERDAPRASAADDRARRGPRA